ncbi:unnamed protein product [Schistocephalus solidus]|uniref:Uncharacterized protein n=1 Tax=Schistocephalus solidus TaxID=70667 RepID=A0A183SVN1_SCHSO|nr:unnamed protein product [Schistocephalus solidus]
MRIICEAGAESGFFLESLEFSMTVDQSSTQEALPFGKKTWSGTLRLPIQVNCIIPRIRIIEDENDQSSRTKSASTTYLTSSSGDGGDTTGYTVSMGAVVLGDAIERRLVFVNDSAVDVPVCIFHAEVETASLVFTPSQCTLPSSSQLIGELIQAFRKLWGQDCCLASGDFFELATTTSLRGHPIKLRVTGARLDTRRFFFSNRVIKAWNALPADIIMSPSVDTFKRKFDQYSDKYHHDIRT